MKMIYWNCSGISFPSAMRSLRAHIRLYQPDIVFFKETILSTVNTNSVVNRLCFSIFMHILLLKEWGSLLCMWHPRLNMELVHISSNIMDFVVYFVSRFNGLILRLEDLGV